MATSGQENRCFIETVELKRRFVRLSNQRVLDYEIRVVIETRGCDGPNSRIILAWLVQFEITNNVVQFDTIHAKLGRRTRYLSVVWRSRLYVECSSRRYRSRASVRIMAHSLIDSLVYVPSSNLRNFLSPCCELMVKLDLSKRNFSWWSVNLTSLSIGFVRLDTKSSYLVEKLHWKESANYKTNYLSSDRDSEKWRILFYRSISARITKTV